MSLDVDSIMNRIEVHKHEFAHVRFHTDRGIFDVSLDELDGSDVLRISTGTGTMTILPWAANVVLAQVRDPYRDAAIATEIIERRKERETVDA